MNYMDILRDLKDLASAFGMGDIEFYTALLVGGATAIYSAWNIGVRTFRITHSSLRMILWSAGMLVGGVAKAYASYTRTKMVFSEIIKQLRSEDADWDASEGTLFVGNLQIALAEDGAVEHLAPLNDGDWDLMEDLSPKDREKVRKAIRQTVERIERKRAEARREASLARLKNPTLEVMDEQTAIRKG